jgi:hypothetical protein
VIALLDLGLFVIHPDVWAKERERALAPMTSMAVHERFLRSHPIQILWSDDFFDGFPWNQPRCPQDLRDVCIALQGLLDNARGQGRLIALEQLGVTHVVEPDIEPDLLSEEPPYPEDLRTTWLWLLGAALFGRTPAPDDMCIPSFPRARLGAHRKLAAQIRNGNETWRITRVLVLEEDEWQVFLQHHHKPDLRGRRVVVLVGDTNRAAFERARKRLATYGLDDCRRLPSVYEQNRTRQETRERLQNADLLVVCTNRITHADTAHLDGDLPCTICFIDKDSESAIVEVVVEHFRSRDPRPER